MGVPGQIPPVGPRSGRPPGHGPFGDKAFKATLVFCGVLVVGAPVVLLVGGEGARAVGTVLLVLGALGLLTGGGGLLAERRILRRVPPPAPPVPPAPPAADRARSNGRAPRRPDLSQVRKPPRGLP